MSKGLEALENLKDTIIHLDYGFISKEDCEWVETIEKELKAFEIIKSKSVNVPRLKIMLKQYGPFCGFYNAFVDTDNDDECLTQGEYDLLKEALS